MAQQSPGIAPPYFQLSFGDSAGAHRALSRCRDRALSGLGPSGDGRCRGTRGCIVRLAGGTRSRFSACGGAMLSLLRVPLHLAIRSYSPSAFIDWVLSLLGVWLLVSRS